MIKRPVDDLVVDSTNVYSLDRCFKCLKVLNLGEKSFCTVILKKEKPDESADR